MMKALVGALVALVLVACSSSDDASSASSCEYIGTYSMSAMVDTATVSCPADDPDAGATAQAPHPITVTISAGPDSSAYAVQLEGFTGGCRGDVIAGCKLQTQCSIVLTDALDPNTNTGTYQFSWTFTHAGFSGAETISLPPAKNYSHGCRGNSNVTATRQ